MMRGRVAAQHTGDDCRHSTLQCISAFQCQAAPPAGLFGSGPSWRHLSRAPTHSVTSLRQSVWRPLSCRMSSFMRERPKQLMRRSRSRRRPAGQAGQEGGKQARSGSWRDEGRGGGSTAHVVSNATKPASQAPAPVSAQQHRQQPAPTLGDDAAAALPQAPVAGQQRLQQLLLRLVPLCRQEEVESTR